MYLMAEKRATGSLSPLPPHETMEKNAKNPTERKEISHSCTAA
jgi:hypothetical protein